MVGAKRKTLSSSGASLKVQGELMKYVKYWVKAKGYAPSVIRVTSDQLKKLGVETGYNFNGSILESGK